MEYNQMLIIYFADKYLTEADPLHVIKEDLLVVPVVTEVIWELAS